MIALRVEKSHKLTCAGHYELWVDGVEHTFSVLYCQRNVHERREFRKNARKANLRCLGVIKASELVSFVPKAFGWKQLIFNFNDSLPARYANNFFDCALDALIAAESEERDAD